LFVGKTWTPDVKIKGNELSLLNSKFPYKKMSNDFEDEKTNPQVYQFSTVRCIPSINKVGYY
jgi:hypothetical protein